MHGISLNIKFIHPQRNNTQLRLTSLNIIMYPYSPGVNKFWYSTEAHASSV